ncbi:MAG: exodeoxyribonuclease V subunit gamma, partial [Solirubrobacteraceae bacterium]
MLTIHRAERADILAAALAEILRGGGPLAAPAAHSSAATRSAVAVPAAHSSTAPRPAPADPLAPHLVSVPTRGIERWLCQQLSAKLGTRSGLRDGVCANIAFPPPGSLVAETLALASGIPPESDPWQPERLVWPLIQVVDDALQEAWLAPLARHLQDDTHQQRYARLARVATLFCDYAIYRPEMVLAWARGESAGVEDGGSAAWQPELWRRLRATVAVASVAERLAP